LADDRSIPSIIPILPSPHLVIFPQVRVSLHVPRSYYERIRGEVFSDSHQGEYFLGIVLRKVQPVSEMTILPIGCVGKVVCGQDLPGGQTVHLDVHGLKRFRMREGWFENSYGQAQIEVLEEHAGGLHEMRRRRLLETAMDLGLMKRMPGLEDHIKAGTNDEALLNMLCFGADLPPLEKYLLLEAEDLNQRCGRLIDLLEFRSQALQSNKKSCQKDR
jgi:Lon protease-like protein